MFLVSQCCKLLVGWCHSHICNSNNWSGSHKILHSVFHNSVILLIVNKVVPSFDAILFFLSFINKRMYWWSWHQHSYETYICIHKKNLSFFKSFRFLFCFQIGHPIRKSKFHSVVQLTYGCSGKCNGQISWKKPLKNPLLCTDIKHLN